MINLALFLKRNKELVSTLAVVAVFLFNKHRVTLYLMATFLQSQLPDFVKRSVRKASKHITTDWKHNFLLNSLVHTLASFTTFKAREITILSISGNSAFSMTHTSHGHRRGELGQWDESSFPDILITMFEIVLNLKLRV
jgi:hypothetical protein